MLFDSTCAPNTSQRRSSAGWWATVPKMFSAWPSALRSPPLTSSSWTSGDGSVTGARRGAASVIASSCCRSRPPPGSGGAPRAGSARLSAVAADGCVFCAVVEGSAAAHVVLDDKVAVGFLDRRPVFKGHVLVVPRAHVVTLADLPRAAVGPFFERVQRVSATMPDALGCDGTFVAMNNVVSQSVAHLHAHVVPRRRKDGLRGFFWPRTTYADEAEAERYATALRAALG